VDLQTLWPSHRLDRAAEEHIRPCSDPSSGPPACTRNGSEETCTPKPDSNVGESYD